jgi:hypothetical protein
MQSYDPTAPSRGNDTQKDPSEFSTIRRIIPKHPKKGYQNEWGALLVQ